MIEVGLDALECVTLSLPHNMRLVAREMMAFGSSEMIANRRDIIAGFKN